MHAGPKRAVDPSPLPWRPKSTGFSEFAVFCARYIWVPKGTGALSSLWLRGWQRELVGSVSDADPQPRIAGWDAAKRAGEDRFARAPALHALMCGGEGAAVIV